MSLSAHLRSLPRDPLAGDGMPFLKMCLLVLLFAPLLGVAAGIVFKIFSFVINQVTDNSWTGEVLDLLAITTPWGAILVIPLSLFTFPFMVPLVATLIRTGRASALTAAALGGAIGFLIGLPFGLLIYATSPFFLIFAALAIPVGICYGLAARIALGLTWPDPRGIANDKRY